MTHDGEIFRSLLNNDSSDDDIPFVSNVPLTYDETKELEEAKQIFQYRLGLAVDSSNIPDPVDWDDTPSISRTASFETISSATTDRPRSRKKEKHLRSPNHSLRQPKARSPQLSPKASVQQMAKSLGPGGIPLTTEEEENEHWSDGKSTVSSQQSTSKNAMHRSMVASPPSSRSGSRRNLANETMMASMPVQHVGIPKRKITRIEDTEDTSKEASQNSSSRGGTHGSAVTHATQGSTGTHGSAVPSLRFGVVNLPDDSSNVSSSNQTLPNKVVSPTKKHVTRSPSTEEQQDRISSFTSSPKLRGRRPTPAVLGLSGRGIQIPSRSPASHNTNPIQSMGATHPSTWSSPTVELPHSFDEVYRQYDSERYGHFYKAGTAIFAVYALVIYLLDTLYINAVHKCGKGDQCDHFHKMWLEFFNIFVHVLSIPLNIITLCLSACVIGFSSIIVLVFDGIAVLLAHPLGLVIIAGFMYTELAIYF